jgi:hypothetical protein
LQVARGLSIVTQNRVKEWSERLWGQFKHYSAPQNLYKCQFSAKFYRRYFAMLLVQCSFVLIKTLKERWDWDLRLKNRKFVCLRLCKGVERQKSS